MSAVQQTADQAHVADIQLEVRINATPSAVWKALTDDIGAWWPSEFFCGSGASTESRRFLLEAHPGGRMWEDWGSGEGLLWGTVVNLVREKTLDLVGTVGPAWGGPSTWFGSFTLEADGKATKLRFSESAFGRIPDPAMSDKKSGWEFLFQAMRAHVEGTPPPVWTEGSC